MNFTPLSKVLPSDMLYSVHCMIQERVKELEPSCQRKASSANLKMHALDLKGLFKNFLQIHYTRLMAQIVRVCNSHDLKICDVVCELDWMPNKYGLIPAMQDPPAFKIVPYWSYINGSRLGEVDWFSNHWTPNSQNELKKTAMKLMLREFGKPSTGAKFILHYANTVAVVSNV